MDAKLRVLITRGQQQAEVDGLFFQAEAAKASGDYEAAVLLIAALKAFHDHRN